MRLRIVSKYVPSMISRPTLAVVVPFLFAAMLGGCTTEPVRPAPAASAPPSAATPAAVAPAEPPVAVVAPTPTAPAASVASVAPLRKFELSPEASTLVSHLTQGGDAQTLPHNIATSTGFPESLASLAPGATAPKSEHLVARNSPPLRGLTADGNSIGLIERDWTGLVLVPINTALSKAYTTAVRLVRIEAHPLQDGRVRIWIRMQNVQNKALSADIACSFQMNGASLGTSPYFYEVDLPMRDYRDVFFVSPGGRLDTYTVLVRPSAGK